ncbi:MAG: AMP-binding protein [Clostridia bacterium]|nr:AMP-binding protein [Clostridia bacterium]
MDLIGGLSSRVRRNPCGVALVSGDRSITYGELWARVTEHARDLQDAGIRRGQRVLIPMGNSIEFALAYYSTMAAHAVAVPVNPTFRRDELRAIMADCRGVAIVMAHPSSSALREAVEGASTRFGAIVMARGSTWEFATTGSCDGTGQHTNDGGSADPADDDLTEQGVDVIIYTSGTTGRPKGVMLTGAGLAANALSFGKAIGCEEHDVHLAVLPMFHSFGATVALNMPLLTGGRAVIAPQFIPAAIARLAVASGSTVLAGVPTMLLSLTVDRGVDPAAFRGLRACISGGAALPQDGFDAFEAKFGIRISEGYGLTEASPVVSVNPVGSGVKRGSVGIPIPGVTVRIVDEMGADALTGEAGEITVGSPGVMTGYFGNHGETSAVMDGAWLRTGDIGRVDSDGYLYVADRAKDMINVAGYKVCPREVEEILRLHPAVQDAIVVGRPDPLRGETVAAHVAIRPGMAVDAAELASFCRRRLANYKTPTQVVLCDSVPRDGAGKPLRRAIRAADRGARGGQSPHPQSSEG